MSSLTVRHNIEVAHRLYEMPGKCQNIHGHSMLVELTIHGHINARGVLEGLEFGAVKKEFRSFLDETFDHHLLLNENDPWARTLYQSIQNGHGANTESFSGDQAHPLPGLVAMPGDPTTEHLAKWIAEWGAGTFHLMCDVTVHETAVNAAKVCAKPNGGTNAS